MRILIIYFSPFCCYFTSLSSKCSSHHSVFIFYTYSFFSSYL
jgi:hypothetical protein